MGLRSDLQTLLEQTLGSDAVYFQPPPTVEMTYPCIVYERSNIDTKFADNNPYICQKRYTVTVIDANSDSLIPDKVGKLARCSFERHFISNNLNHDVYVLYF